MKKKLAFAHNLPVGGGKRTFYSLIPLLAQDYEITVHEFEGEVNYTLDLASADGIKRAPYPPPRLPLGVIQRVPIIGPLILYCCLKPAYKRMADGIASDAPDCVFVSHCRYTQAPLLIMMLKQPVVYFCHEPHRSLYEPPIQRPYSRQAGLVLKTLRIQNAMLLRYWDRRRVMFASSLIANSYYSAESIYRIYGRKAISAQLGVDTKVFYPRAVPQENIVLSVGSLQPIKAHDFVIRCMALLPKGKRPTLIITSPAGTQKGPERKFLEAFAPQLRVKLEFRSLTDDNEMARLYSASLATIFTPHLEPFGLVSLESMACGTPVLGVAEGGLRETILHDKTGFLLPWRPEAFAASLQRLATERGLREKMGKCGVDWVRERFTWRRCAESVIEVVEQAISSRDSGQ